MIRSALMNVMTAAAIKAGRGLKRDYGEVENLQVSIKGPGDFVTAADRRAEKTLFEELSRARPGYCFLMEESGAVEGADKSHVWHIDPLDGTSNFLHGIPIFAVSVALEREGQIVAGLVYNPASDDLYVAEKGQGAFHNNRRMRVAARRGLAESMIACGIPPLAGVAHHARFQTELAAVNRAEHRAAALRAEIERQVVLHRSSPSARGQAPVAKPLMRSPFPAPEPPACRTARRDRWRTRPRRT